MAFDLGDIQNNLLDLQPQRSSPKIIASRFAMLKSTVILGDTSTIQGNLFPEQPVLYLRSDLRPTGLD